MNARDIEIAVAEHFNPRINIIVPNVSWGLGLKHEADMIIMRPSGLCDEVEIKVSKSDIKADAKKRKGHWEHKIIARVWFAVPMELAGCECIPEDAGILGVKATIWKPDDSGKLLCLPWKSGDGCPTFSVNVVRPAKLRGKQQRMTATNIQRLKLAELGCMRIWSLKRALKAATEYRKKDHEKKGKTQEVVGVQKVQREAHDV